MGVSFSMSDVAKITGLHKNTVRNYIQRGELKAAASEDKRVTALFEKNASDLIREFMEMSEYVSPRVHKRLKDRSNIYLEHIEPRHYAIHVGENRIEYKTR